MHAVLKKGERLAQVEAEFAAHRARLERRRELELRDVRRTALYYDAEKVERERRAKLDRRLVLRNVLLEGVHLCVHEFKIDLALLRQRSIFPHSPYQKGDAARAFLTAVKTNRMAEVEALLARDPLLVYEYDECR